MRFVLLIATLPACPVCVKRRRAKRSCECAATHTTLHSDVGRFERRYVRVSGRLLVELDDLNAEIARLKSQAAPGDLVLKDAARQADERASESREAAAAVDTGESPVRDVTPDLRRLHREACDDGLEFRTSGSELEIGYTY